MVIKDDSTSKEPPPPIPKQRAIGSLASHVSSVSAASIRSFRSAIQVPSITITPELHEQIIPTPSDSAIGGKPKAPSAPAPNLQLKPTERPTRRASSFDEDVDDLHFILRGPSKSLSVIQETDSDDERKRKSVMRREKKHGPKNAFVLCRRQVYTVFWTNLLMRYRMKVITLFEVLFPILVIWVCIMSLTTQHNWKANESLKKDMEKSTLAERMVPQSEQKIRTYFCNAGRLCDHERAFIVYSPNNEFTRELIRRSLVKLIKNIDDGNKTTMIGVATAMEVADLCKDYYIKHGRNPQVEPVGIIFSYEVTEDVKERHKTPTSLSYEIRTFLPEISNTLDLFPYVEIAGEDGLSAYIKTGFVGLQSAIETSFIEFLAADVKAANLRDADAPDLPPEKAIELTNIISLQMFPFTVFLDLLTRENTWGSIMLAIIIGYFCTTYFTLNRIILHRNAGILKMLRLHGMSSAIHWLSLLFYEILFHTCICIGIAVIFFQHLTVQDAFFKYTNPMVFFLFLYLHGIASYCFCLFIGSFFKRPALGSFVGFLLSFLSYFIPFNWYILRYLTNKWLNTFLCALFPNWCLANGIYHFLRFESYDSGVGWISEFEIADQVLWSTGTCMIIFTFSSVVYFTVTVLLDAGYNKRLLKAINKRRKQGFRPVQPDIPAEIDNVDADFQRPPVYEEDKKHPCNVKLRNVTVVYNSKTIALDNVSSNFHEGQITLVLGYNGAGKSTLLNVIAGLTPVTSGKVLVNGVDPYNTARALQKKIGFCPKKLSLFPSLSVEEHIRLCCLLHGNSIQSAKATTIALLKTFRLFEYRQMGVKYITENQLRKLGLAMAMSNNCSVLLLEEPTFGMNASERVEIWACLQTLKKRRTIIVSMGSLDDGDFFADRIALMSQGKMICCGSPAFLNKTYDIGSFIKVRKTVEDLRVGQIFFFVHLLYPEVGNDFHEVKLTGFEEQENYLYIRTPRDSKFSQILHTLECYKDELGISELHVIHNTLAGIFYKLSRTMEEAPFGAIGGGSVNEQLMSKNVNLSAAAANITSTTTGIYHQRRRSSDFSTRLQVPTDLPKLPTGIEKRPNSLLRLMALVTKQLQYNKQKYSNFLIEYLVAFILLAIFIYFCQSYLNVKADRISRQLGFDTYPDTPVPVNLIPEPYADLPIWKSAFSHTSIPSLRYYIEFYNSSDASKAKFVARRKPNEESRTSFQFQVATAYQVDRFRDIIGFYASNAKHAAPVALNVLHNVILQLLTPKSYRRSEIVFRINASNYPLSLYSTFPSSTVFDVTNALCGVIFSLVLCLIAAPRILLPFHEKRSGLKYLQIMAGVRIWEYWLSFYIFDMCLCALSAVLLTLMVYLFDSYGLFFGMDTKLTILSLSAVYLCWAVLPFGYIFSRIILSEFSGVGQFVLFHIIVGALPVLITYLVFGSNDSGFVHWVRYVLEIFPCYTITSALVQFCEQVSQRTFCARMPLDSILKCNTYSYYKRRLELSHLQGYGRRNLQIDANDIFFQKCCEAYCMPDKCLRSPNFFAHEPGDLDIYINLLVMLGQGVFYWCLLIIFDSRIGAGIYAAYKALFYGNIETAKAIRVDHTVEDPEVMFEQEKIKVILELGQRETDTVLVSNLTQVNRYNKTLDHVYFAILEGNVVGLLGSADSGKAEVIRILTGQIKSTLGDVNLKGISLNRNRRGYLTQIGFSPASPPLLPHLTGLQLIELMGRIRGIPAKYLTFLAKKWLTLLGITDTVQLQMCRDYKTVEQMQVSFAMALIGHPELIIFEEPTKKLEDHEQLQFWNFLALLKNKGKSILITSASAEECSQICTKLVMMHNGHVSALGIPQDVFDRYPKGWSLMIRLYTDISTKFPKEEIGNMTESLKKYLLHIFSPCELTEERDNVLFFYLKDDSKSLSFMYGNMEEVKSGMPDFIDEYFLEKANLDDVIGNSPPPVETDEN